MSRPALPTYEQVLDLPVLLESEVTPDFIDVNGHMNVRHYLDAGAHGADVLCRRIGIDDAYRAQRRLGIFTAEHHIRYFSEMHEGEKLSVHTAVVDRSARAGHLLSFILDRDGERLACTVEIVIVGVDMDTRRPAEFPADVAAALDERVEAARRLPWPLPLSGAMGIRRD
ncbi:thioesterase family protein [Nocardioides humi]|uniref:Acyl-CoA thioester hydrolase n=1 Tax=Nocardioides humi TaxID=449461 RepID=A0ABN2B0V2_9ACTN|nr:thioesterase family protein [Nocardioides humi]